ncbi:MAG: hypothetical protein ABII82_02125 [Verrucomicrobiota bacterium]
MKFLAVATWFAALTSLAHAALFDLTGASVGGTLQLNGGTYSSGPSTINAGDGVILDFNLNFDQGPDAPSFSMIFENADSPYLFSDRQGVLSIVNTSMTPFIFQSGFNLTITGLFAAPGSPVGIGDFELVDGYDEGLFIDTLITEYDSLTGTLVIRSEEDIELPDMINLNIQGRFLEAAIPEPASAGVVAGIATLVVLAGRRRSRRAHTAPRLC